MSLDATSAAAQVRRWVERFVIAENLCPFASRAVADDGLRIAVCAQAEPQALALAVLDELQLLARTKEDEIATTLLVFTHALESFDDYLDFLAFAEELLEECGLSGVLQIASFHPDYVFDGVAADDVSHYTNRAPLPLLHFLREEAVAGALAACADPDAIPARNVAHLRALGLTAVRERLRSIQAGD